METRKTRLSKFSNIFFILFSVFLLLFFWCNFYIRNTTTALLSSIIILFAFSLIFFPLKIRKSKTISKKKDSEAQKEAYKIQLLFAKHHQIFDFLKKLYKIENFEKIEEDHYIDLDKQKDIFIFFYDNFISERAVVNCYKNAKFNDINLFCISTPKSAQKLDKTNLTIIDFDSLYKECISKNIFPDFDINLQKKAKFSIKDVLCVALCKERSKGYFWFGVMLLFSSMFTLYSVYYIVFSTVLILLSIFSRFNPFFNN